MTAARPGLTLATTALALIAFAANSVLCRLALAHAAIDPAGFTLVRLLSGTLVLVAIVLASGRSVATRTAVRDWRGGALLFAYAAAFSYAYLTLAAGTGALILFGTVQLTMLAAGWRAGERPGARHWLGSAVALGGLVWLVAPGLTAPDARGAALMAIAGIAWGAYSLRGRGGADPIAATCASFVLASAPALLLAALAWRSVQATPQGLLLAAASGAIASGLGYVLWYAALRGLTLAGAATAQLAVPALAAAAGVLLLGEVATLRLLLAGGAILGGVALALTVRR